MLLEHWSHELIEEILSTLPAKESQAISCYAENPDSPVSLIRAKKFGFVSVKEWQEHFETGIVAFKERLADKAIFAVDDLPFIPQGISSEGRILKSQKRSV